MKRPLAVLVLALSLGIFMASHSKISFLLVYTLAGVSSVISILLIRKRIAFSIFLTFTVFLLGITLWKNTQSLPSRHISKYVCLKNKSFYIVKGFINSEPAFKNNRTAFIFKTEEVESHNINHKCCGSILVSAKGKKDLRYGEALILRGDLSRPFGFKGSGRKSYRHYLYNQGICFMMNIKLNKDIFRLNKNKGFLLKRFALWLKNKIEAIIFKHITYVPAGILDAMVLGEKRNIPALIYNSMIKSGTVHILVVSGFNVGVVTFAIILFLKLLRVPRRMRIVLAIPLLIIYCLLTGASTPVVRATVMAIVFMLAYWLKREPDIYNSCAIAALFILGINPRQLFDIGFQLSFASVLSIVCLYPKIKSFLGIDSLKIRPLRFILEGCIVSLSCWLGTLGFIAYYFKIFSPVTVLANLFIVPLATLITLSGFSLIIIGSVCPPLASVLASSSKLLVLLLLHLNAFFIKLPAAYFYLA